MGHQLLLSIWLAHQLDALFEVDLGSQPVAARKAEASAIVSWT